MNDSYKTIFKDNSVEFEEKKSIFIGHVSHVKTVDEALEFIKQKKKEFKDATHNCSAYIVTKDGLNKKYDDDGEPIYSAGMPILSVLEKNELENIVCVVTRYFGGVKLGKGGLVRAYTKACTLALADNIVYRKKFDIIKATFDYTHFGIVENFCSNNNFKVYKKEFLDTVIIKYIIENEKSRDFMKKLTDLCAGKLNIEKESEKMCFYDGENILE